MDKAQAAAEYRSFLRPLLAEARLTSIDIEHTSGPKLKVVTPIPNIKEVGHDAITFTVKCTGELSQLVEALEAMERSPYEHRIRNLTINREDLSTKKDASTKLNITMIIETLLVAKTENRPGISPGAYPYILAAGLLHSPIDYAISSTFMHGEIMPIVPNREYADIGGRNIFVGALPPEPAKPTKTIKKPPPPEKPIAKAPPEPDEPKEYVPDYVYLTTCVPEQHSAYLRNRLVDAPNTREMLLIAKDGSGHDIFAIMGPDTELGRYIYFRAKILKVELRQIYFQIGNGSDFENFEKDGVYSLQIGQPLSAAKLFSSNYSKIDLEDLGLYNRAFEKAELKAYQEKNKKDNKDNKGKFPKKRPN
jgi:hypothetical protein